MARYYRGVQVFASEDEIEYYIMYNEGVLRVVRTPKGVNPEYVSDGTILLKDLNDIKGEFKKDEHHEELISTLNNITEAINQRHKDSKESAQVLSALSISSGRLCAYDSVISTVDTVKEEIKYDKKRDLVKGLPQYKLLQELKDIGVSISSEKAIVEFLSDEVNRTMVDTIVEQYKEDPNEEN